MIALIDYDAGNMKSVEKALQLIGEDVLVTRDPKEILAADKVVLPGVGSFGDAMENLHHFGLVPVIHQVVQEQTPFLGICLGLQLLFEKSEESPGVEGLGISHRQKTSKIKRSFSSFLEPNERKSRLICLHHHGRIDSSHSL